MNDILEPTRGFMLKLFASCHLVMVQTRISSAAKCAAHAFAFPAQIMVTKRRPRRRPNSTAVILAPAVTNLLVEGSGGRLHAIDLI